MSYSFSKRIFWLLSLLLIIYRFFHFDETLDSPHTWRQSDTANYIYDFYLNGIDLLHPSVCWMGGHKTLLLEFPLPEAMVSLLYQVFGPSHIVARAFFFISFLVCALYFFRIVRHLWSESIARFAFLIYLSVPLSLFFSRAVHIDFFTMALVHICMYYLLKFVDSSNRKHLLISAVAASIGFLVKAPYFLPIVLPLLAYAYRKKRIKQLLFASIYFIPALLFFYLWQRHSFAVNNAAPDWHFLQGYRKFTDNVDWYFGPMEQRYVPELWELLKQRFRQEILGISGISLMLIGIVFSPRTKYSSIAYWWLGSSIIYLLVFYNLNLVHNYYQVPFIAPIAIIAAIGLSKIYHKSSFGPIMAYILFGLFLVESIKYAEKNYYVVQTLHMEIGEIIRNETQPDDLCIVNHHEIDSKCPNFLYAGRRNGWTLPWNGARSEVVLKLMEEGASKLIISRDIPLDGDMHGFAQTFPTDTFTISDNHTVYVIDLRYRHIWDSLPEELKNKSKHLY